MKKLLAQLGLFLILAVPGFARQKVIGWCQNGGVTVVIPGVGTLTQTYMGSFPGCQVTVFSPPAQIVTKSPICSDNAQPTCTLMANPFNADSNTGFFQFYPPNSRFDLRLSGGTPAPGISPPITFSDLLAFDPNDVSTGTGTLGVFSILNYGGKADALQVSDGSMSNGSAVLTSVSGLFNCATVVGMGIHVEGAGAAGVPLLTTIASCQSTTQVTLNAAASTLVNGASVTWGTEDGTACQAATNAATQGAGAVGGIVFYPQGQYFQSIECWDVFDTRSGAAGGNVAGSNASHVYYLGASGRGSKIYAMGNNDHWRVQTIDPLLDGLGGPEFGFMEISGPNSFANAVGIHIGDTTAFRFDEMSIHGMRGTNGAGAWIDNTNTGSGVQWTERFYIGHVQFTDNRNGVLITRNGGTNSVFYSEINGAHFTTLESGFIGLHINGGITTVGSRYTFSGNIQAGSTFVKIENGGQIDEQDVDISAEGVGGTGIDVCATCAFVYSGTVREDSLTNNIAVGAIVFHTYEAHNTNSSSTLGSFQSRPTWIVATTDTGAPPTMPAGEFGIGGAPGTSNIDFLFGFNTGAVNNGRAAVRGLQCPAGASSSFLWTACTQTWDIDSQGLANLATASINAPAASLPNEFYVPANSSIFGTLCTGGGICQHNLPNFANGTIAEDVAQTSSISPGAINAQTCVDATVAVVGANLTMSVAATPVGPLPASWANVSWSPYISSNGSVTIHVCNPTGGTITPVANNFVIRVIM